MSEKIVLITDYTWPSTDPEAEVLARIGAKILVAQSGAEEELLELVPQADAILTCFADVTPKVIEAGHKLQVVGRYGIGVDNIAVDTATSLGIPVTNVPVYCADEVAEHVLALLFASARAICKYDKAIRLDNWDLATGTPMYRIRGRTLGILGFGHIGRTLASKAESLGVRIIAYDPYIDEAAVTFPKVELVGIDDIFSQADFLSVHTPLIPQTEGLIDEARLRTMKSNAIIVNCARGAIIDHQALERALREGWIAAAAADVFEPEHLDPDHPLFALPNLIATPHVAFYSEESVAELEIKAAENVAAVLSGRRPEAVVNAEVLDLPRWSHLKY
ncbi:MAG: C-terminal binding protein [Anaerolineales bacterium]|nr:C-terminal binding protein [Anaerolineales bacterium]